MFRSSVTNPRAGHARRLEYWKRANFLGGTAMPSDAKLGLLVGVGVVVAIALVYFKPESKPNAPPAEVQGGHRAAPLSPLLPAE